MSFGGGGNEAQNISNEPWGPAGDAYKLGLGEAKNLYNQGGFGAIAPQSDYTQQAQQGIADRALGGGSGILDNALGQANSTIGGDYLDLQNNPFFQDAISYAQKPVTDAYTDAVNNTTSQFAGAGRLGSGAFANQLNDQNDILARNLAGAATTAGANAYGQERGMQQQAMGMAPGLEAAGYSNLAQLGGVGSQQDAYNQALAEQGAANLGGYGNFIQGVPSNYGSSRTTGGGQKFNPYGALIGGGMLAASLYQ